MNLEFDEQHSLLRRSVREFAKAEIEPYAQRWDREETFPMELVPKLAAMGLLGIRIPEEYGGAGMDTRAYANSMWSPPYEIPEPPPDGIYTTYVTFDQPGTYTLRAVATDGAAFTYQNVTVTVTK